MLRLIRSRLSVIVLILTKPANPMIDTIKTWHDLVHSRNAAGLDELLSDEVVFHSPVVHTPQKGKIITKMYLSAALHVFANETFHYVRQIINPRDAALEFEVEIDDILVNGVDMIQWDEDGRITDFKVMVRPLKAMHLIHEKMAAMLQSS